MAACEAIMDVPEWEGSDGLLALLYRSQWDTFPPGNTFLTDPGDPLQVGLLRRPAGSVIPRHEHPPQPRTINRTMEVLLIRSGQLLVQAYNNARQLVTERTLGPGDLWIQVQGGHGFTVLEECEFIEVKQGPYTAALDKVLF